MSTVHKFLSASIVAISLIVGGVRESLAQQVISGPTMGTAFRVKIVASDSSQDRLDYDQIEAGINNLLRSVNQQMSTYIKNSEISRFNRYRGSDGFPISSDLAHVLKQAIEISELSNGAFDVTVGPLVNLWGFGPEGRRNVVPTDAEITSRMSQIGYEKLAVRLSPPGVKKKMPEIFCDLSAIAKGFGVDKVAEYLESQGIENYMVEIGGEVRAKGQASSGESWRIGIERPDDPTAFQKILELQKHSVATSGDYINYFKKEGVRYSHTIDPRTGRPITHNLASVTVIHASCMIADGVATALHVLGPVEGFELAQRQKLAVFMIVRHQDEFVEMMTPEFEDYLVD